MTFPDYSLPEPPQTHGPFDVVVELGGIYDGVYDGGWSVGVTPDGTYVNRWADADGNPIAGHERKHKYTADWIAHQQTLKERT